MSDLNSLSVSFLPFLWLVVVLLAASIVYFYTFCFLSILFYPPIRYPGKLSMASVGVDFLAFFFCVYIILSHSNGLYLLAPSSTLLTTIISLIHTIL